MELSEPAEVCPLLAVYSSDSRSYHTGRVSDDDMGGFLRARGLADQLRLTGIVALHDGPVELRIWLRSRFTAQNYFLLYEALDLQDYLMNKEDELQEVLFSDRDPSDSVRKDWWFYYCGLCLISGRVPRRGYPHSGAQRAVRRRSALGE